MQDALSPDRLSRPTTPDMAFVALRHVCKRFPGVIASDDVSIDFRPREVHALLGENGAGKSTLVSLLAGVLQPDDGHIEVEGKRVAIASPRSALAMGIGTVFQHSMLVPTLSVVDNFALGGNWWKKPDRIGIAARIRNMSARMGVRVDPGAIVNELSLGERQQAEILRAVMRGSRCLILDEPTAMLTPLEAVALGELMRRLVADGLAIIFITHKLDEALAYADRISILRRGRKTGEIGPETLHGAGNAEITDRILRLMFGASDGAAIPTDLRNRTMGQAVLEVEKLCSGSSRVPLLDVSFAVRSGEILGIAGIDGNGQKELAEILSGQDHRSKGSIRIDGREISGATVGERRRLGLRYVTDDRLGEGTVGAFSVAENLLLKDIGEPPYWRAGLERPQDMAGHAERLISAFDIRTPSPDTPVGRLSGGNIQKVILARELTGAAKVVIFAKPTYGLDVGNTHATRNRIREAARSGAAVVLISTDLDELLELSDRIAVMDRGRILQILGNDDVARKTVGNLISTGE